MKLLLDQNLSPRLVHTLADLHPECIHVREVGLETSDDQDVWIYARDHQLTVVSKDADFRQLAFLRGAPPKAIWIRRGNCSTRDIEAILREYHADILAFEMDVEGVVPRDRLADGREVCWRRPLFQWASLRHLLELAHPDLAK